MQNILVTTTHALAPICFCIALGWMAGKLEMMPVEYGRALARFVVLFALPIALFLAAAKANPADIFNVRILLSLLVGFGLTFLVGWFGGHLLFKHGEADSALQALACSFPNIAYCGPPVLVASVGSSALLMVVTGNLIVTLIVVPIALVVLARSATDDQHKIGIAQALWNAVKQPLIFLPIAGACVAAIGVKVPELAATAANEIGVAAGGAALFALGLTLSGIQFHLNREVTFNVLVKNVLQPVVIFGAAYLVGLRGPLLAQTFLLGVLPTATEVSAIAVSRNVYRDSAAGSTLASVLASIFTIAAGVSVAVLLDE
ncbi:AEC family transporter [Rhizobium ruizarguesonis]|uniref:AEC family transporter n=1 Tax=Rhizobium ruizarguesonis TaxID=2081791 RepID=UPI00102F62CE|nr:AEC family transporter [Rhizobium ruizarguesonis]TAV98420.1 AEC family transporter [Rhizobium ruizarguesonis]TBC98758.1 AEC family transporter [Rhizobium ruizarguesonis]TBD15593.1 AEC family transporter [Rhizobium ruizarguesonis]TBE83497.1 AEC family transporter [Rhizobium ruizarguesonis]